MNAKISFITTVGGIKRNFRTVLRITKK